MANLKTPPSQFSETITNLHQTTLFALLFIYLFFLLHSSTSMAAAAATTNDQNTLLLHDQPSTLINYNLHHRRALNSHSTLPWSSFSARRRLRHHYREFEAGAHEVPSGPNPISNRSPYTMVYADNNGA